MIIGSTLGTTSVLILCGVMQFHVIWVQALAKEAEQKLQSQDAEGLRTELSAREVDLEALRQHMEDLPSEAEVMALRRELHAGEAKSAALEEEAQRVGSELAAIQSRVRASLKAKTATPDSTMRARLHYFHIVFRLTNLSSEFLIKQSPSPHLFSISAEMSFHRFILD